MILVELLIIVLVMYSKFGFVVYVWFSLNLMFINEKWFINIEVNRGNKFIYMFYIRGKFVWYYLMCVILFCD